MVIKLIVDLSGEMLILSMLVKVVGSREDKEDCNFLEALLVVHLLWGGVPIGETIKFPNS